MTNPSTGRPLVVIAGPTGSGKSELALEIAGRFGGEIVNCDSLQVYRYFDVGTAKLTAPERKGIQHHLLDVADPDENFSAGDYSRMARQALVDIADRGRVPIVAGGTGLYVRALIDGLFPGPSRDEALRRRLTAREARGPGSLHRLLMRLDGAAAGRIHPHDVRKLVRAVEVCLLTKRSLTAGFSSGRDRLTGFLPLKIGINPPRKALYERLNERCRRMFDNGLLDEVRRILLLGFSPDVKPLESHGYKQALQVLRGQLTVEEAVYRAQQNTRRYAKRQWTWFRREAGMEWVNGFGGEAAIQDVVGQRIVAHLGGPPEELGIRGD